MALSSDDQKRISEALEARVSNWDCSLCGESDWTLADGIVAIVLQDTPGTVALGGRTLANFALTCSNCGNTLLLNGIVLGLRDIVEKEKKLEEEPGKPEER